MVPKSVFAGAQRVVAWVRRKICTRAKNLDRSAVPVLRPVRPEDYIKDPKTLRLVKEGLERHREMRETLARN